MAKKIKKVVSDYVRTTNYCPQSSKPNPMASAVNNRVPQMRPARHIGRMLALQQLDGIDGTINNLFKGQFDDSHGDVDPACDIHTDPHIFQDTLIRSGYEKLPS